MRRRCENPKNRAWDNYGGRGIRVCRRWRKFENFFEDMGSRPSPKHSIERVKNHLGYNPKNCVWATKREQNRNTRRNYNITYKGRTMCLTDWAEQLGMSKKTLRDRIVNYGWSIEKAFTTQVRPVSKKG